MMCEDAEDSSESAFVAKEANPTERPQQVEWLINSGASKHMTCDKEILQDYQQFSKAQSVKLGDGRVVDALGLGNVKMRMTFKVSDVKNVTMYDVLYVPKAIWGSILTGSCCQKRKYGAVQEVSLQHMWERSSRNGNTKS